MIAASTASYALALLHGVQGAAERMMQSIQSKHQRAILPGVQVLREVAAQHDRVLVRADGGVSRIAHLRSLQFEWALESGAEVWLTVDDDVGATPETLSRLLAAVARTDPIVIAAPCYLRGTNAVNVAWSAIVFDELEADGTRLRAIDAAGFGLVAMNRSALLEAARVAPRYGERLAPFHELMTEHDWFGEDISFFRRLPPGVRKRALLTGRTEHAGNALDLASSGPQ